MPPPRVSIRLGTDGKAQVVKDFADIGDSGDAQAKRIGGVRARRGDWPRPRSRSSTRPRSAWPRSGPVELRRDQPRQPDHRRQLCAGRRRAAGLGARDRRADGGRRAGRATAAGVDRPALRRAAALRHGAGRSQHAAAPGLADLGAAGDGPDRPQGRARPDDRALRQAGHGDRQHPDRADGADARRARLGRPICRRRAADADLHHAPRHARPGGRAVGRQHGQVRRVHVERAGASR
jgi:hypothetical protein